MSDAIQVPVTPTTSSTPIVDAAQHPQITPVTKKLTPDDLLAMYDEVPEESPEADDSPEPSQPEPAKPDQDTKVPDDITPKIQAKLGDKNVDIDPDAIIPIKVGDKEVEMKISDLVETAQKKQEFELDMARRVTKVAEREKKIQREYSTVEEKAKQIVKLATQGDVIPAIKALAKIAAGNSKIDPVQYEIATLNSLESVFRIYSQMTPEQRTAFEQRRRAEALAEENRELVQTREYEQAEKQLQQTVQQLCQENGLSEKQFFEDGFGYLAQNAVGEGKMFKSPDDIQPADVVRYLAAKARIGLVDDALTAIDPKLTSDEALVKHLDGITVQDPSLTKEDLMEIIKIAINTPSKSVENLNRKAQKNGVRAHSSQAIQPKKARDVDEDMYNFFFSKRAVVK